MYGYTENTSYISKGSLNEKLIHVTVMVSNASEVTAIIDNSLVFLTLEELKSHNMDTQAHQDIRENINVIKEIISNIDISWEGINGKPTTFPPASHTHDELYYTEREMDTKLNGIDSTINTQAGSINNNITASKNEIISAISSGPKSPIKSIQRFFGNAGSVASSGSYYVTMNHVDTSKAFINVISDCPLYIYISSSTSVRLQNIQSSTSYTGVRYNFEVIEFY